MKKFIGIMAAMAVLGLAAGAQAQSGDISGGSTSGSSGSSGQGGSGSMGGSTGSGTTGSGTTGSMGSTTGSQANQQQLEGKVLKAEKNSITIEHMGAAVNLQVQSSTSFQGVKSAKDIKEGSQVRASFNLKGAKNEATSIEVLPSTGGSGSMGSEPSGSGSYGTGSSGSTGGSGSSSGSSGSSGSGSSGSDTSGSGGY